MDRNESTNDGQMMEGDLTNSIRLFVATSAAVLLHIPSSLVWLFIELNKKHEQR
jgi:hypothetical protein